MTLLHLLTVVFFALIGMMAIGISISTIRAATPYIRKLFDDVKDL